MTTYAVLAATGLTLALLGPGAVAARDAGKPEPSDLAQTAPSAPIVVRAPGAPLPPRALYGTPALTVAGAGGQHAFFAYHRQDSPRGAANFPSAVTALSELHSAGGQSFALFAAAHLRSAGTGTSELNTFNEFGPPLAFDPAAGNLPNRAFGIATAMPVTLTLAAGGAYQSHSAIQIAQEGGRPNSYLFGLYGFPGAVTRAGIFLDAPASGGVAETAVLRNSGEDRHVALRLETTGRPRPANPVLEHRDAEGRATFSVRQSGRIETPRIRLSETGVIGLTPLSAEPEAPSEGDTYYDARRRKLRTFDGTVWHDLW